MADKLQLQIEPQWENLEEVRNSTEKFLTAQGVDINTVHAITMVTCELTENATKYGDFAQQAAPIEIAITLKPNVIVVEVVNPAGLAAEEHLMRLDEMVQWIRGFQDPFEAYLERLKEVSGQRLDSEESGLGLVRVAYEGQSILDFYVNEKGMLAVSAMHSR